MLQSSACLPVCFFPLGWFLFFFVSFYYINLISSALESSTSSLLTLLKSFLHFLLSSCRVFLLLFFLFLFTITASSEYCCKVYFLPTWRTWKCIGTQIKFCNHHLPSCWMLLTQHENNSCRSFSCNKVRGYRCCWDWIVVWIFFFLYFFKHHKKLWKCSTVYDFFTCIVILLVHSMKNINFKSQNLCNIL